jgi:hypothetical protein
MHKGTFLCCDGVVVSLSAQDWKDASFEPFHLVSCVVSQAMVCRPHVAREGCDGLRLI